MNVEILNKDAIEKFIQEFTNNASTFTNKFDVSISIELMCVRETDGKVKCRATLVHVKSTDAGVIGGLVFEYKSDA